MRLGFVIRGGCVALPVAAVAAAVGLLLMRGAGGLLLPPDPTPPPPTIAAARGEPPPIHPGLQEWVIEGFDSPRLVGSGFLLEVDERVVGVVAAHSARPPGLRSVAFRRLGDDRPVVEFDALLGSPGVARTGSDMTVDYLLLASARPASPLGLDHALLPDPRGLPQPGERVTLYAGLDGSAHDGTVQSAAPEAVWVIIDETFVAGMMSGSPLVSRHTGHCIGMLIAGTLRRDRLLLAAHPIGSLVSLASALHLTPLGPSP